MTAKKRKDIKVIIMKRFNQSVSVMMVLAVLAVLVFPCQIKAFAVQTVTENQYAQKLSGLREKYPSNSYWNKANGTQTVGGLKASMAGDIKCGCECTSVCVCGSMKQTCGELEGVGWRGFAFANLMALEVFGSYATKSASGNPNTAGGWQTVQGDKLTEIYAGDLAVLKNGQALFIIKVTDSRVYYVDCNRTGPCRICWDRYYSGFEGLKQDVKFVCHYSGSTLKGDGKICGTLTVQYNINGGTLAPAPAQTCVYRVRYVDYINLRSEPKLGDNCVGRIPLDTEFKAQKDGAVTADGFEWIKASYNGKIGWVAKTSSLRFIKEDARAGYYQKDSVIYSYESQKPVETAFLFGEVSGKECIADKTFGLSREGYNFMGWSLKKDSSVCLHFSGKYPEEVLQTANTGDMAVTLYAVWKAEGASLFVPDEKGVPGSDVTVLVQLSKNPGFVSGALTFSYNKQVMEIVSVHSVDPYVQVSNSDKAVITSDREITSDGTLLQVTFRFADDARAGDYPITVTASDFQNLSGKAVEFNGGTGVISVTGALCTHEWGAGTVTRPETDKVPGEITYECVLCGAKKTEIIPIHPGGKLNGKGDVDGIGGITSADARLTLRYSVGLERFTAEQFQQADVNDDGKVNAADARLILRAAVGLD